MLGQAAGQIPARVATALAFPVIIRDRICLLDSRVFQPPEWRLAYVALRIKAPHCKEPNTPAFIRRGDKGPSGPPMILKHDALASWNHGGGGR